MPDKNVDEELKELVESFRTERSIATVQQAFPYWFMEEVEDLSREEAADAVVDGKGDGGIDAWCLDEETGWLNIYQMKYAETRDVVIRGFRDINRGVVKLTEEKKNIFREAKGVRCVLVTSYRADEEFEKIRKNQRSAIKKYLKNAGYSDLSSETKVEVFDQSKFAQLMNRIFGVELSAKFHSIPVNHNNAVLGLIDARDIAQHVGTEELLAFNIRGFLKMRKGSINWGISETLRSDRRQDFWQYNNGLVCICTEYELDGTDCMFQNFTIVNGAQTINTIAKFLDDYQTEAHKDYGDPVWTVIKVIKLKVDDVRTAITLTKTSNNQNAASNSDIRAVDPQHAWMKDWFGDLGYEYVFRRGITGGKKSDSIKIKMKDVAQAYIAYYGNDKFMRRPQPHISFARSGSIFSNDSLYESVFPRDVMSSLNVSGSREDRIEFVRDRLLPLLLLTGIRKYLEVHAVEANKRWRSIAFQMLAVYSKFVEMLNITDVESIIENVDELMDTVNPLLYEGLRDFAVTTKMEIPKAFKTPDFLENVVDGGWITDSASAEKIKDEFRRVLT